MSVRLLAETSALSPHELVTGIFGLLTLLVGAFASVLAWLGKDLHRDVRDLREKVAVLGASNTPETVHDHAARIAALEMSLAKIATNVEFIAEWIKKQERKS